MSRWRLMFCALVLCLLLGTAAAYSEECPHSWHPCDLSQIDYAEISPEMIAVDDSSHMYLRKFPKEECTLCDATRGFSTAAGYLQPHSFSVEEWYRDNENNVFIFLKCHICEFQHEVHASVDTILAGTSETCLLGGACVNREGGSMYPQGIESTDGTRTDAIVFTGIVETPCADGRSHLYLANRVYCPVCGQPELQLISDEETTHAYKDRYEHYSTEAFLSTGMPQNLPYQVIDTIKKGYSP